MNLLRPQSGKYETVDLAVFLDVDRCMYNTEKAFRLLADVTGDVTSYKTDDFLASYDLSKRENTSFNYVSDINRVLGDGSYQTQVEPAFIEAATAEDLRMPGATEIIEYLERESVPFGFVTFGYSSKDHTSQSWLDAYDGQIGKCRAAGYDQYPHLVCDDLRKGDLFQRWLRGRELWVPSELSPWEESYVARHAVLLDDKAAAHVGSPKQVSGIHVVPADTENAIVAQRGHVPERTVSVNGLTEALGALKHIVSMQRSK